MAADKTIHILVVDDFENIARTLRSQLRGLGFTKVDVAVGGLQALEKLKEAKDYGLILADWTMPDLNGLQLLQKVREDKEMKGIRFLMVTGNTNPGDVAAAKKLGVNGYVIKPYNLATLKQRLEGLLGPLN
ncbi:MAG TPA: response regulator [Alphaproteobacteria bacterium]|nr:response regulator [Alphaproteobacteria bacterium]